MIKVTHTYLLKETSFNKTVAAGAAASNTNKK